MLSPQQDNVFILVNQLLAAGVEVDRLPAGSDAKSGSAVTFRPRRLLCTAKPASGRDHQKGVTELGLSAAGVAAKPAGETVKLKLPRVVVWDKYGGTTPGGWTRWLLGKYGFGDHKITARKSTPVICARNTM